MGHFRGLGAQFFQVGVTVARISEAYRYFPPKERAREPNISKFEGLRAKIWAKIEAVEAKISHFVFKKGSCEPTFFRSKWGPRELRTVGEAPYLGFRAGGTRFDGVRGASEVFFAIFAKWTKDV